MAIGDAAAAAGLAVFPSSQDLRLGWQNDMIRGDEIAALIAVVADKLDAAKILISPTEPIGQAEGGVWIKG